MLREIYQEFTPSIDPNSARLAPEKPKLFVNLKGTKTQVIFNFASGAL